MSNQAEALADAFRGEFVRRDFLPAPKPHEAAWLEPAVAIHRQRRRPVAPLQSQQAVRGVAEDVVADHKVCGRRRVVVEHQMTSVGVRALAVAPAQAGIHASVVFKQDVVRPAGGSAIPILEGVFTVPDVHVAS